MKHLFIEGKFIDDDNKKIFRTKWNSDTSAELEFDRSFWEIEGLLMLYEYMQIDKTDYYVIYRNQTPLVDYKPAPTKEEVYTAIKKILDGDIEDVINDHDLTLGMPNDITDSTVHWDVANHFIVVNGVENLKLMVTELYMSAFSRCGIKRTTDYDMNTIKSVRNDIPIIDQVLTLCEGSSRTQK